MTPTAITVTRCADRVGAPRTDLTRARAALDGLLGVSLTPTQARDLARDLYQAAATCDARTYPPRDEHPAEAAARRYGRD